MNNTFRDKSNPFDSSNGTNRSIPKIDFKLEFLICGSPNDAFWSQVAMFRMSLDSFGPMYKKARLVMCLGHMEMVPLPERWRPYFENIEIAWADQKSFIEHGDGSDHIFNLIDDEADISFICDADTIMLRPFSERFLMDLLHQPAICAVIAHYPPPMKNWKETESSAPSKEQLWSYISNQIFGRSIPLRFSYTMRADGLSCPFYVNYGMIASPPALLKALHRELNIVQPMVRKIVDNEFYGQISIALAVEKAGLAHRSLRMRFNFPNDPMADKKYPLEMKSTIVMHYLRVSLFDRHKIFADRVGFEGFLNLSLKGSNLLFQNHIKKLTRGTYPFE